MQKQFKALLEQMIASGQANPELLEMIDKAMADPTQAEALLGQLSALTEGLEAPLDIEDFYVERDGSKFELRWELSAGNPFVGFGVSFDSLDRKSQFFVLFAEWQRRETEGLLALNGGNLADAETVFKECLERADQIDVNELRARSYENLMRVAERRGDAESAMNWLNEANSARGET